jgi:hypothetical protein
VKKLKGPDLKDLKVPPVLRDLFQDLRDRRLLPLLALVLVAIVAVPFLLGNSEEEEAGSDSPSLAAPPVQSAEAARLTVVEAKPGLRDYRKRLRARVATDPFKQRYTAPVLKGAELPSESTTSGGESSSTTTTTESSTGAVVVESPTESGGAGAGSGNGGGGGGNGETPPLTLFTFVVDVQYAHTEERQDGRVEMAEPTKRERVKPYTPLPGVKAPVVTYLGVGAEAKTALLMVSSEVTALFGDGKCISGTERCELLEVEPGIPQTFEYGPNGVRYKINVLKIEPLVAGHL